MRVALVHCLYAPHWLGGAEVSTALLAQGLLAAGHDVTVICGGPDAAPRRGVVDGVPVRYLPIANVYNPYADPPPHRLPHALRRAAWLTVDAYNPWMGAAVGRELDDVRPDVVHTNNLVGLSSAVWGAAARRRLPILHTLRDYYLLCVRSSLFRAGRRCRRRCADCRAWSLPKRLAARHVGTVVGISRHVLDAHLARGWFAGAAHSVIPNAVDDAPAPAAPRAAGRAGPLRFGFLGQITPFKGVDLALAAFRHVDPAAAELHIAGRGPPELIAALRRAGDGPNVHWRGFVDAREFLAEIDVLLVPSVWDEPAGRVVLEAYAAGKPVIASNRGGLPEMVGDDGAGLVFDADRPATLSEAVRALIEDRARLAAMAARAVERARRHGRAAIAARYADAYRALRSRSGPPSVPP
jgi:glycosyltransferase involved in cell wall biosynthesis